MPTKVPRMLLEVSYEESAREYQRRLPPEHYMESNPHATQRKITLESFDLIYIQRPDIQLFSELLVQYPLPRTRKRGQVVPDNMVVIHPVRIEVMGSYNLPLQPARPFCMLEYVSSSNARKDYTDNMHKYEHELKVLYYLLFRPEAQEMKLYRHNGKRYVGVEPNVNGRLEIRELELEVALLGGWMRYWFRRELLPLPGELLNQLAEERREVARLRAELAELKKAKKNGHG